MNKQTELLIRSPFIITQYGYHSAMESTEKLLNRIRAQGGELTSNVFMNTGQFHVKGYADHYQVPLNERDGLQPLNYSIITVAALDEPWISQFLTEIQPALQRLAGTDLMMASKGDFPFE